MLNSLWADTPLRCFVRDKDLRVQRGWLTGFIREKTSMQHEFEI